MNSILLGSGVGIAIIFIPIFFLTSGFENASYSEILFSFISAVLTGMTSVLIATIILPSEFSFKTFMMGVIALPVGSFIYAMIVGFLFFIGHRFFGSPMRNISLLLEAKNAAFLTTLVYGHVFFPLSLIATSIVQWLISLKSIRC
ncbi:hypothetical protein F1728_15245 [Gimesia benthica]|uniref:Uncharacterized protein n=1 Tax=Gimesia benthica TaxID=2608982 RepID=A0A6I6AC51_9PLAN|nr:hypothetical protein [Gimesia benthica]QGQ23953.1 hypothetical protein F1728_15245 [Gimesia benthica]